MTETVTANPVHDFIAKTEEYGDEFRALMGAEAVQPLQEGDLRRGQFGVPHIDDQHDAGFGCAIPRLVFQRIVEHEAFCLAPVAKRL